MIVRKSFQYSLRLTKKQKRELQGQLDECRWLYNELLSQRKLAYEECELSLSKYQQNMLIPFLKEERPELEKVHSQVLQNVVDRLDKAYKAFFRRCKEKEKVGFPRFRGFHRYDSFCYPQSGFAIIDNEVKLSKVGSLRIKMHRPLEGEVKTCTLKKHPSGEWSISFSCEVKVEPKAPQEKVVGIDMGLIEFATFSDKKVIPNPCFFKKGAKILAKAQKKLAKYALKTKERAKQGKIVAKIHERISNQRKNFCHQESKKIVDQYQYICVEELNIKKMVEGSYHAKSIMDASWNQFLQFLTYKAVEAGRKLGIVNPAFTTQDCYECGYREKKRLNDRTHLCKSCGYMASRDFNSAQNILALGLDGLGVRLPRSLRL